MSKVITILVADKVFETLDSYSKERVGVIGVSEVVTEMVNSWYQLYGDEDVTTAEAANAGEWANSFMITGENT